MNNNKKSVLVRHNNPFTIVGILTLIMVLVCQSCGNDKPQSSPQQSAIKRDTANCKKISADSFQHLVDEQKSVINQKLEIIREQSDSLESLGASYAHIVAKYDSLEKVLISAKDILTKTYKNSTLSDTNSKQQMMHLLVNIDNVIAGVEKEISVPGTTNARADSLEIVNASLRQKIVDTVTFMKKQEESLVAVHTNALKQKDNTITSLNDKLTLKTDSIAWLRDTLVEVRKGADGLQIRLLEFMGYEEEAKFKKEALDTYEKAAKEKFRLMEKDTAKLNTQLAEQKRCDVTFIVEKRGKILTSEERIQKCVKINIDFFDHREPDGNVIIKICKQSDHSKTIQGCEDDKVTLSGGKLEYDIPNDCLNAYKQKSKNAKGEEKYCFTITRKSDGKEIGCECP